MALAVLSPALVLLLVEAGSYLMGVAEGPAFPLETRTAMGLGRYDHDLFWRLEPSARSENGQVQTNSHGWRGPELVDDEAEEFRVLVLGESSTFGWELPYEQTYVSLLQSHLDRDQSPGQTRLVNAALPGYTLVQGVMLLEREAKGLGVDAVLLAFGFNDSLPVTYLTRRTTSGVETTLGLDDWALMQARRQPVARLIGWLTEHSNAWRWIQTWRGAGHEMNEQLLAETIDVRPRVPESTRLEMLERLRSFCEEQGLQLVLTVPWYRHHHGHEAVLRSFAVDHAVPLIDLPLEHDGLDPAPFFLDVVHPNVDGHALIAKTIHEGVTALGW